MGTTFTPYSTKAQLVQELISEQSNDSGTWKTLKKSLRGNQLWTICEFTPAEGESRKFLLLHLFMKHDGDWGYKSMPESEGPYYYNCPVSYLDEVDVTNQKWRDSVIQNEADNQWRKTIAIGKTYQLTNVADSWIGRKVTITSMKPLLGSMNGQSVRLQKKLLAPVEGI